jgi:LysM repeat protein
MVSFSALFIATIASSVARAAPLHKRIDQTIADSTTQWVAACQAAGGADQCGTLSVSAFQTLLAAGDPCDHQDQADDMMDLAHTLKSDPEMIRLAQLFVQQPRNAPDSLSVLYCQKAPRNSELNGLFQCQFQGCNPTVFTKNVAVGGPSTIPFGMTAALSPAGSCPANPSGPIADGVQLNTLTKDPGVGGAASAPAAIPDDSTPTATSSDAPTSTSADAPAATPTPDASASSANGTVTVVVGDTCNSIAAANGVDVGDLMNDNPDINADCTNLEPGQTLELPSSSNSTVTSSSNSTDTSSSNSTDTSSTDTPTSDNSTASGPAVSPPACAAKASKRSFSMTIAKRIAQADLPAVAQSWQDLCLASGGDVQTNDPCVQLAGIDGINGLLAGSDPCLQQDNADAMIDFANSAGITNKDALIANAVAYRKHPRNALDIGGGLIPSSPFCQKAPKNQELVGIVNGQLDGVNPGLFGGPKFPVVAFGNPASCPFGQTPDVDTCTCS